MMSPAIRVVLIDDHRHIHELVSTLLTTVDDVDLIGQGSNGDEALLLSEQYQPDVLLLDVVMPRRSGLDVIGAIRERFPAVKVLALSSFQDDDSVRQMLTHGAVGYVLKGSLADDLLPSIRAAFHGTTVISQSLIPNLLKAPAQDPTNADTEPIDFGLTARETQVLQLMAQGYNNVEIAERLVISQSTVKFHLTNILYKLGVETRSEAIVVAAKNNLI